MSLENKLNELAQLAEELKAQEALALAEAKTESDIEVDDTEDEEKAKDSDADCKSDVKEAMTDKQTALDKNHNGKLDSEDFAILRKEKAVKESEELEEVMSILENLSDMNIQELSEININELSLDTLKSYSSKVLKNEPGKNDEDAKKKALLVTGAKSLRLKTTQKVFDHFKNKRADGYQGAGDRIDALRKKPEIDPSKSMFPEYSKTVKDRKANIAGGAYHKQANESEETKMDLGQLFEGQDLSEEFKAAASELFEAAVKMRVEQEVEELQESFKAQALTESEALKESLVDKVDGYLDFMVEQWMNKNELAINRGIKTEILESFVSGMKEVFESHYIDVPDEKYDLVEAAQAEVQELEARLDEEVAKSIELTQTLKEISRQITIDEAVEGMVETDAEKFRNLAEELSYTAESFDAKLAMIKESYFSTSSKPEVQTLTEEFMTDEPVVEIIEESTKVSADMARYLTALERSTQ